MAGFRPRNSGARWSRFKSQLGPFIATCSQTVLASVCSPVQCKDSPGTPIGPEGCSEGCCVQSVCWSWAQGIVRVIVCWRKHFTKAADTKRACWINLVTCRNHGLGNTGPGHWLRLLQEGLLLPAFLVSPLAAASPFISRLVNMRSGFPGFVLLLGAVLRPCTLLPTILPISLTPKAPDSLCH